MASRPRSSVLAVGVSAVVTAVGVALALQLELLLGPSAAPTDLLLVGLIEEALVRLAPLILTFYLLSHRQGRLLTKTEGFLATVASGGTVAGLEFAIKLEYLARLEAAARFDALVLPILFVHLPFALVAGRFAYALGERLHGTGQFGRPELSRRTLLLLVAGYLVLAIAHVLYNLAV